MCPTGTSHSNGFVVLPTSSSNSNTSHFRQAFNIIDSDGDGRISRDDLRTFYSRLQNPTMNDEALIQSMIFVADSNKDGFVEYDEFQRVLASSNKPDNGKGKRVMGSIGRREGGGVIEDMFKVMDQDGDGKVGFGDLKSYLSCAGISVSDDEIKSMISLASGDNIDDGVSFDGFVKIFGFKSSSSLSPSFNFN